MTRSTGVSQGGGGVSERGRRIDDIRQLQQDRRRQALSPQPVPPPPPPPQQQQQQQQQQQKQQGQGQNQCEYDVDEMVSQMHRPGDYLSDANTISSSTFSGGGRSGGGGVGGGGGGAPTSSTIIMSPANSTRSMQSRRKNMMKRRIEMRRMNEERLQQEKMILQQQQLPQQSQTDAPHAHQPRHSSAREANHYPQPDTYRPNQSQQQNHHLVRGVDQQHNWGDYNSNSDQNQARAMHVQRQHFSPQESQPQLQNKPDQYWNAQQSYQHPHRAQLQQLPQQYQLQQQSQHQYSKEQAAHLILLSPPMLQRTGEPRYYKATHQYNVGEGEGPSIEVIRPDGCVQYSVESKIPGETNNYQVYNESELERSGIIRDCRPSAQLQQQQHQQPGSTATIGRWKNNDAPSDEEWHGENHPSDGWHGYDSPCGGAGSNNEIVDERIRLWGRNRYNHQPQQQHAQFHLQSQKPSHSKSQTGQMQHQQPHPGRIARHDAKSQSYWKTNAFGHEDVMKNPSSMAPPTEVDSVMRHRPHQMQSRSQSHQHTQDCNQLHDKNQYQSQKQAIWTKNEAQKFEIAPGLAEKVQGQVSRGRNRQPVLHQRQQQDEDTVSVASIRKVWVEKTNSLMEQQQQQALRLAQQRRRQQKQSIEDRWMNNRRNNTIRSMPPPVKRDYTLQQHELENQGYQSEGELQSNSRSKHDGEYQSQDLDAITPKDARNRLWDEQERLRPKKSIEDRWMNNRRNNTVRSMPPPEKRDYTPQQHELETQGYQSEGELQSNSRSNHDGDYQSQDLDAISPKDARNRLWDEQERLRQKKSIEDRWMNNRRNNFNTVRSMPPPEKRDYSPQQHKLETQGYQSEGELQSNSRSKHDGEYQSQDPDAITPKDARNRLWDEQERLRAVLPKNETFKRNDIEGRWLEHRTERENFSNDPSSNSHFPGGLSSPGNRSGSSLNSRFKSKFVHAAALATHQQLAIVENDDMHRPYQSQESQWHHQHQQQLYDKSQHRYQPSGQRHQQPMTKKNYHQKSNAVSSHYTDSTAETTADVTTIPEGSTDSSPNRGMLNNNSSRMSNNLVAQRVSPSPPNRYSKAHHHDNSLVMPPIVEQGVSPSLQTQTVTKSVADLIARINAVSRSNPAEALAEIDFIIKKEGGGYGNDRRIVGGRRSGVCESAIMAPQEVHRNEPNDHQVMEGHRRGNDTPASMAPQGVSRCGPAPAVAPAPSKIVRNNPKSRPSGKDFFPDEDAQSIDREKFARGVAVTRLSDEDYEDQDDDDDSLLSSDDSTVSSMTNPTYQSVLSQKVSQHKAAISTGVNTNPTPSTIPAFTETTNPPSLPKPSKTLPSTASDIESHYNDTRQQRQQPMLTQFQRNSTPTNARVPTLQSGITEKTNAESRNTVRRSNEERKQWPFTNTIPAGQNYTVDNNNMARDQRTTKEKSSHLQVGNKYSRDKLPTQVTAPKDNMLTEPKTMDFPEIMMVVSDAFADVDINLEAVATTTTDPSTSLSRTRPKVPVLQSFESKESTSEPPLPIFHHRQHPSLACSASLQETISEAFSDVDIGFGEEKTISERRKQLEYLSKSWVDEKKSRMHESSKARSAFFASKNKPEEKISKSEIFAGSSWVRESLQSPQVKTANKKKKEEPAIRLKGNKNLAQKFARLVNAFE